MRNIIILLAVLGIGVGAYFLLRDDGVLEQVTEAQVESALLANGVPAVMAECMAPKLTDRLSINQLRKLQRIAPQEGEGALPASTDEAELTTTDAPTEPKRSAMRWLKSSRASRLSPASNLPA